MDPLRFLAETRGFFTRAEAEDVGYDDGFIASAARAGEWVRFRRGYYTFADLWAHQDAVERHRTRCYAVHHSLGDRVAFSHISGAILHGVAAWGVDLDRVHVTRLDGASGRAEGDVVHHAGRWLTDDVVDIDGIPVMSPQRSVLEAGSRTTKEAALVMADSALHLGLCTQSDLMAQLHAMTSWPYTLGLQVVARMSDGGAQSPGESRGRYLFWSHHLPAPVLQYEVRDSAGTLVGTCDWGWPQHGLLGEFDGRMKYGRLLDKGQTAGDVVFAEKLREDRLREVAGMRMVRLVWSDLERPRSTAERIARLLRLAA